MQCAHVQYPSKNTFQTVAFKRRLKRWRLSVAVASNFKGHNGGTTLERQRKLIYTASATGAADAR